MLATAGFALRSDFSDGPTSVPSCSWPLTVTGKTTPVQAGLIKCYLRALAQRDRSGLSAVADQPASIGSADFALSADARSGKAQAAFAPNLVAGATVDVDIKFADGAKTSVEMILANPASWNSWRLQIGPATGNGHAPPAASLSP
jgi:hypothetical protein